MKIHRRTLFEKGLERVVAIFSGKRERTPSASECYLSEDGKLVSLKEGFAKKSVQEKATTEQISHWIKNKST